MLLTSILIFIACGFASTADKLQDEIQFDTSIFWKLNPHFWCRTKSADKPFLSFSKFRADGWHLAKSMKWVCIGFSIPCYSVFIHPFVDVIILGVIICKSTNLYLHFLLLHETYNRFQQ